MLGSPLETTLKNSHILPGAGLLVCGNYEGNKLVLWVDKQKDAPTSSAGFVTYVPVCSLVHRRSTSFCTFSYIRGAPAVAF